MNDPLGGQRLVKSLLKWANTLPHGLRTAGGHGGFSFIQFHTRPDPRASEVQLTLRAAIVDGEPVIQVPELDSSSQGVASTATTEGAAVGLLVQQIDSAPAAREATAVCEGCGAIGTIGRAVRTAPTGEPTELHRFCASCWPEQSARYRARWREEDRIQREAFLRGRVPARGAGPGMQFVAATWHSAIEMVAHIENSMRPSVPPQQETLARFAADLERQASGLDGEMPVAVETFIRRYGTPPV